MHISRVHGQQEPQPWGRSVRHPGLRGNYLHPGKGKSGAVPVKTGLTEGKVTQIIGFLSWVRGPLPPGYQHLQKEACSLWASVQGGP